MISYFGCLYVLASVQRVCALLPNPASPMQSLARGTYSCRTHTRPPPQSTAGPHSEQGFLVTQGELLQALLFFLAWAVLTPQHLCAGVPEPCTQSYFSLHVTLDATCASQRSFGISARKEGFGAEPSNPTAQGHMHSVARSSA